MPPTNIGPGSILWKFPYVLSTVLWCFKHYWNRLNILILFFIDANMCAHLQFGFSANLCWQSSHHPRGLFWSVPDCYYIQLVWVKSRSATLRKLIMAETLLATWCVIYSSGMIYILMYPFYSPNTHRVMIYMAICMFYSSSMWSTSIQKTLLDRHVIRWSIHPLPSSASSR